jgi:hypothetical protein
MGDQDPADSQMYGSATLGWNQRISSLVNAIVDEPVGAIEEIDQLLATRLNEAGMEFVRGGIMNESQRDGRRNITETGQLLQRVLGCGRKPDKFADHQIGHIVGVTLGVDAFEIPRPARMHRIERDQAFVRQCRQELINEKRIAIGFLQNQLSQIRRLIGFTMQRVSDQLRNVLGIERAQRDLLHG